ncbi:hypothetical protein FCH28_22535 [Streptomyces piniterrae]|uniref:Barstar (barnase inhibitor) domain-containing protein n=1 Tax=Streptomyces piniterrae TaxID=2571125 RepID=A0A4U0N9H0_9ACTN|nr:barstar family protein [Streptomyces piniterrae]TJZ50102.1 hypothetical protein FCH28_22535 [Streptomyces piniterrae]
MESEVVTTKESWIPIKPWLHVVGPDAQMPTKSLLAQPGLTFTAWLIGSEMRDTDGVFQQFWDGFKLPDYFGWNFPALNDCLRDLSWIPANQYFLFIEEAHAVLHEHPEEMREFFDILSRVGAKWSYVKHPEGTEEARFQIILGCSKERLSNMTEILQD